MNSGLFLFYVALIAIFLVIVTRYTVARLLESRGFGQIGKDSEATTIVSRRQTEAQKLEIENALRQSILEAKEVALQVRSEVEAESRDKRAELQKLEQRLTLREEKLDSLSEQQALRQEEISRKEKLIAETQTEAEAILVERRIALEKASGLTSEEAKKEYLRIVETDSRFEASKIIRQIESEAKRDGDTRARRILTDVIQRCAVEQTSEATVSVVALPSEEMKGRLIGKEGRNIRAFETYTGVDLVIDDTPEAVVLSSFDPVRREVARIALTSLILDGRIHPARIEEVVRKSQEEVEAHILEEGERAVIETKITGLAPEMRYLN